VHIENIDQIRKRVKLKSASALAKSGLYSLWEGRDEIKTGEENKLRHKIKKI
jgi:hypothetical protein